MRPWLLGNTTVRSPFRLREALIALTRSPLQGHLHGREQERAFRELLGAHGVVELGSDATDSLGRKWRSALSKLGFLYPDAPKGAGIQQAQIGPMDTLTPNGWRLVRAESVPAMQECFLRALAAHYLPSPLERDFPCRPFSPLRHTLAVMLELERLTGRNQLSFLEMALVVQLSSGDDGAAPVAEQVLALRARREQAPNKRSFDQQEREEAGRRQDYAPSTFNDYADTNFRYLKATGLVQSKGRGIALTPEKHLFIVQLAAQTQLPDSTPAYFQALTEGAQLPTDDQNAALAVMDDLLRQVAARGLAFDLADRPTATPADLEVIRHELENLLAEANERDYAAGQAAQWEEIAAYMALLISRGHKKALADGTEIVIPRTEAPAYFEWVLWRALLALGSQRNPPYEARRFKIDQDFLPVGTAPGNGPDLVFEFADFVLAVEVTLTTNSRQEAAEGEPVRRHVADLVQRHPHLPVYGLFLANKIDSNTAETFRIGVWYTNTDARLRLNIVPLTLTQFKDFFEALFQAGQTHAALLRALLDQCTELRPQHEAPAWKLAIADALDDILEHLNAH